MNETSTQQGATYNVDIVMCIDTTASMAPVIEKVKEGALQFHKDLSAALHKSSKRIDRLRVKVIDFRDFYSDGDKAMRQSSFFTLPDEETKFEEFVRGMKEGGGGDLPECGLEALASAIQSDWNKSGDRLRHVIVLYTDDTAHPLDFKAHEKPANYPQNMPKNLNELTDQWEELMNRRARRLLIMAPNVFPWTQVYDDWEQVMHFESQAGKGLSELSYDTIINTISNTI